MLGICQGLGLVGPAARQTDTPVSLDARQRVPAGFRVPMRSRLLGLEASGPAPRSGMVRRSVALGPANSLRRLRALRRFETQQARLEQPVEGGALGAAWQVQFEAA